MTIRVAERFVAAPMKGALVRIILTAFAAAVGGCGGDEDTFARLGSCEGEEGTPPEPPSEVPAYDLKSAERAAPNCAFAKGALTKHTVGPDAPKPPEDAHVVLVMLENRSFDHYLSGVPGTDYTTDQVNPNPEEAEGVSQQYQEQENFCLKDTPHEWGASHLQYNNGRMDGFAALANANGRRAMAYFGEEDLPFVHWLARNFAVGDRHFSSLLGPTWPNRLFFSSGTSCGFTEGGDSNLSITHDCGLKMPSIYTLLRDAGVSYEVYDDSGPASVTVGLGVVRSSLLEAPLLLPHSIEDFEEDAAEDRLPSFSMVGASTGEAALLGYPEQNDGHPPSDVRLTDRFLYRVVRALMKNQKTFKKTILFITFDEHGGLYDHVVPPPACEPESLDFRPDYRFDRYGIRVPMIVVSPFVKEPGYVSKFFTDLSSVTRFIEHWKGLKAMTARDANAWPMLDYFDFTPREAAKITLPPEPPEPKNCGPL